MSRVLNWWRELRRTDIKPYLDAFVAVGTAFIMAFCVLVLGPALPVHKTVLICGSIGCVFPMALKCLDCECHATQLPDGTMSWGAMKRWHWISIPCCVTCIVTAVVWGF